MYERIGKNGAPPRFERGASCNFEKVPKAGIIPLDHEAWLLLMEKNSRLKSYVGVTHLPRLSSVFVCWRKRYEGAPLTPFCSHSRGIFFFLF